MGGTRMKQFRETNYFLSEDGKVIREGKEIKGEVSNCNYKRVMLYDKSFSKRKKFSVHRMMAETYVPNPNNLPQVNHINGDKLNNHYSNLEWITPKQNCIHREYLKKNDLQFKGRRKIN